MHPFTILCVVYRRLVVGVVRYNHYYSPVYSPSSALETPKEPNLVEIYRVYLSVTQNLILTKLAEGRRKKQPREGNNIHLHQSPRTDYGISSLYSLFAANKGQVLHPNPSPFP